MTYNKVMTHKDWTVELVGQAKKALKDLPKDPANSLVALLNELEKLGPVRYNWANYSKLKTNIYHCHLEKGRPLM